MSNFSTWAKRLLAGTTAAAVGIGGVGIGQHFWEQRGAAGAHGAVVDMDEQNGMLLHDLRGRPAFANYFDSTKQGEMRLSVSLSTTDAMPHGLTDKLGQLTKYRQTHVSSKVEREDYRAISPESAEVIRDFFREFEELTGIQVDVRENSNNADIVIGGYLSQDDYIGFASFPQEIPFVNHLPQNQGFMMLDTEYLAQKIESGNIEAVLALVSHEFGHNLGFLHPHDDLVHTAMNDKQQDAVARMSYNNHTFPAIAATDINSGYGPLEIHVLRDALRDLGVEPPRIHPGNDTYLLSELAETQRNEARAKAGSLASLPALSLLDNGGSNTLEGTSGRDLLVTEAGDCGLIDRDQEEIRLMRDGQPYCLVEGEFSVVRSGAGDDLILTANGTEQTVYLGSGNNEVAMIHSQVGDKEIVTLPIEEDERGMLEQFGDAVDGLNPLTEDEPEPERATEETARDEKDTITMTMHQSLFRAADTVVQQSGDDIEINFYAMSGREIGSITLQGQAAEDRGINTFRVINDQADVLIEFDVTDMRDPTRWQEEVLDPIQQRVSELMIEDLRRDFGATRQVLAGTAGEWTSRGDDPADITSDISDGASFIPAPAPDNWVGLVGGDKRPEAPDYPNDDIKETHQDAIMRRRREGGLDNDILI